LTTGQVAWVQQFVHHDLLGYGHASAASLLDLDTPTAKQPALVVSYEAG